MDANRKGSNGKSLADMSKLLDFAIWVEMPFTHLSVFVYLMVQNTKALSEITNKILMKTLLGTELLDPAIHISC